MKSIIKIHLTSLYDKCLKKISHYISNQWLESLVNFFSKCCQLIFHHSFVKSNSYTVADNLFIYLFAHCVVFVMYRNIFVLVIIRLSPYLIFKMYILSLFWYHAQVVSVNFTRVVWSYCRPKEDSCGFLYLKKHLLKFTDATKQLKLVVYLRACQHWLELLVKLLTFVVIFIYSNCLFLWGIIIFNLGELKFWTFMCLQKLLRDKSASLQTM